MKKLEKTNLKSWQVMVLCIILVILVVAIYLLAEFFFSDKEGMQKSTSITINERISEFFPNPDRIILKPSKENAYWIITKQDKNYTQIIEELDKQVKQSNAKSQNKTQEEMQQLEESDQYVMLDYYQISKNYVLSLSTSQMMRYTSEGAIVVRENLDIEHLQNLIQEVTSQTTSDSLESKELLSKNKIEIIPEEYRDEFEKTKLEDTYQMRITQNYQFEQLKEVFDIASDNQDIPKLEENDLVIATISKYSDIKAKAGVRKIEYTYSSRKGTDYTVHLLMVSKVVNSESIYHTFSQEASYPINQIGADGMYRSNEYLPYFRVYSDYAVRSQTAMQLGFTAQKDGSFTILLKDKKQLDNINQTLKLNGFSQDGNNAFYRDIFANENRYQYMLCVKNTTGHYEVDLQGRGDYVNGINFDMKQILLNSYELTDSEGKTKLQGNVIAIPKQVTFHTITVQDNPYDRDKFEENTRKITVQEAKQKAKDMLGTMETQAFLDILSGITPFENYNITYNDSFRRVWVVTKEGQTTPTAVVIDATTGKIIDRNELGC